jgi:hypothetical protein
MSWIQKFFTSRENTTDGNTYVGQEGRLFYKSNTNALYVSDGVTIGGVPIVGTLLSATAIATGANAVLIDSATPIIITGMTTTPSAGTYIVNFNSQFVVDDTSSQTLQAKTDLIALYDALVALTVTDTGHVPTYGAETLGPGVYYQAGATNITGTLTLDASDDPDALFVFRCDGAFTTGASAEVVLINGATSSNVWFVSEGAASTGADTIFRGSIIANQAAVSTGAGTSVEGRMFAITGAVGIGAASIFTRPTGTSVMTLGLLDLFNLFTGTGNISNTGASEIQLSIGTNSGTITGFDTATVGGSIIPGGASSLTIFRCAIYVDGVIVQDSLRSTSRPFVAETFEFPIVLQTVITVAAGQTVDVRAYSELGIQTVGPRMALTLLPINN